MLQEILQNPSYENILFVGIGNLLKKDDGIGVYIAQNLEETKRLKRLVVEVSIENYIGKINAQAPDLLILVDAMDLQAGPGRWSLMPACNLRGHTTNTHNISLGQVCELFNSPVYILGIQPQNISLGEGFSRDVRKGADALIRQINQAVTKATIS